MGGGGGIFVVSGQTQKNLYSQNFPRIKKNQQNKILPSNFGLASLYRRHWAGYLTQQTHRILNPDSTSG
jgi:hypothetical protein